MSARNGLLGATVNLCGRHGTVRTLDELKREVVETVLWANDGNKPLTAKELGISLKTLYNMLNRWEGTF